MEKENQSPEVKTQKPTSKKYNLNWIIGILFIIIGLFSFGSSIISKIFLLLTGLILLPPVAKFIKNKYGFSLSRKMKIIFIILVFMIVGITQETNVKTSPLPAKTKQQEVIQPQTFEDRLKVLTTKTGVTDISYKGIDDEEADSNRPAGSRMITVKLNIDSFYNADSLYRDTGELTGKILQETFRSNSNAYKVIVWYYGEVIDNYGNKTNKILLSQAIDKTTYQKINWQNFDSTKLCDFLRSEELINDGETACNTLVDIK